MNGERIRTELPLEMFRELVDGALCEQHLEPSDDSAYYLVRLLESFVSPQGLHAHHGVPPECALGELFCHAVQAEGTERFLLFQLTGDLALFLSGFFPDSLERNQVSARYYHRLGASAYSQAAGCCRPRSTAPLFEELAESFAPFMGVLNQVSERCLLIDTRSLLQLYERWAVSRSSVDAERLQRHGIVLSDASGHLH